MTQPSAAQTTGAPAQGSVRKLADAKPATTGDPSAGDEPSGGDEARARGYAILLGLAVLWLAATMWSDHASLKDHAGNAVLFIVLAAIALPGLVMATMVAGAAAALAAVRRFASARSAWRRLVVALAAGAVCGAIPGAGIAIGYGTSSALLTLVLTVVAASLVGGASAMLRPALVGAGLAATLGVIVTGVLLNLPAVTKALMPLFGGGPTVHSRLVALERLSLATSLIGGLVAGLVGYAYLRRSAPAAGWPAYLLGGAMAGLYLLASEAVTLVGGARLFDLVAGLSDGDRYALTYVDGERLTHALIVGFTGAIVATIMIGRTLRRPDDGTEPAGAGPEPAGSAAGVVGEGDSGPDDVSAADVDAGDAGAGDFDGGDPDRPRW